MKPKTRAQLAEELEDRKNGDLMEQEEFEDICGQERIRPSPCCSPKYCRLAPFHEIEVLREALRLAKVNKKTLDLAEKNVLRKRAKRMQSLRRTIA